MQLVNTPDARDDSSATRGAGRLWALLHAPRSLRVQLAAGSALIVVCALVAVALSILVGSLHSFNDYQGTQLQGEVNQVAVLLGRTRAGADGGAPAGLPVFDSATRQRFTLNIWIMDASGQLLVAPPAPAGQAQVLAADQAAVVPALERALQGHSGVGTLPGPQLALNQRYYAVAPIHQDADSARPIIGAVALANLPPRQSRAEVFAGRFQATVLLVTLAAALLAALAAALFSRRITRPVARLAAATERMASGDYATRVEVSSPDELRHLAESFNGMAAALEADVTQLRRQEQLRRELVANVSHELATPLTAIQGFTEALLDGVVTDPADREETTRLIAREAARLQRLVAQLRQVARFEAGAETVQTAPLALAALADETLAVLAPELERKSLSVTTDFPANLSPVQADGDRLTEILLNLLDNAIRHTPEGGRIAVAAQRTADGAFVRISVSDSGPGVAEEERERVFDRFYRSDPSRAAATGGTGLGLAIVRALVEAHGGAVTVEQSPEGGASFSFTLPVAAATASSSEHVTSATV